MCIIKVTKKVQNSPEGGERMLIERLKEKFNLNKNLIIISPPFKKTKKGINNIKDYHF